MAKTRAEKIRAFFAVALDAPARRAASALAQQLREGPGGEGVRWVREESLHVTLRFLGQVETGRIAELVRRAAPAVGARAAFSLRLGAPMAFPPRRPRVVALQLLPEDPLLALAAAIEGAVVEAGLAPEPRAFRPHLTIGRSRGPLPRELDPSRVTVPDTAPGQAFDVTETVLFRSQLQRSGARYLPLERLPLGAPGGSHHPSNET